MAFDEYMISWFWLVSDDDTQRSFLHFTSTQVYDVLEGEDAGNLKKKNDTSTQAFETSKNEELNKVCNLLYLLYKLKQKGLICEHARVDGFLSLQNLK